VAPLVSPTFWRGRRVFLTGHTGFKGGWLALLLEHLGAVVTGYAIDVPTTPSFYESARVAEGIESVTGDIRVVAAVTRAMEQARPQVVFHLAAQSLVRRSHEEPVETFTTNVLGTANVLEAVRLHNHDAPLVFASTNKVYGKLDHNNAACKETQPIDFHSPYGCSKGAADQYVRDYARCFGMNTVVLRQSCIYGAHQYGTEDQGWVAHFVHSILKERPLTIYGDGTQVRDLLDARDLSSLYATVIDKIGITRGEIYNVGGGPENQRNLLEVIDQIGELTGKKPQYSYADWREGDQSFYVSDISKAKNDLGWEPQVAFDRGLRDLISWAESVN